MSTETEEPRRTIATSSLRALRAARGDAPPPTSTSPDESVSDDTSTVDTATESQGESGADADTDTEVDTEVEVDTAGDQVADADPVANADDVTTSYADTIAEPASNADDDTISYADVVAQSATDTDAEPVIDTDDAPPVLASGRSRHPKRTSPDTPARPRRRPSRLTAISAVVAAVALVFGVVSGVVWWNADHDTARAAAVARDEVVVDARLAVATVNTSDYRKPAAALDNWLAVSTGTLKSQFTDQRKPAITLLGQSKIITSATVLDAAVTKLDTAKGSATVIVSVNLKRKPATGAATTARNRFRATLTRQGDDWKLADLVLVGFQLQ